MEATQQLIFEKLWQQLDSTAHADVKSLWKKHLIVPEDQIDKRSKQVVFAVKTPAGEVIGVSTAYRVYVDQLKHHLYAYRCFIDPGYRMPGLVSMLTVKTRDLLEEVHATDGPAETRCIGMIAVVENERLMKYRNEAIWPASKMVYIGNTAKGQHIRVYYFRDARI